MPVPGVRAADAVTQTPFQARAVGELLDLWQLVMPQDAPDGARLRDIVLLDPAFSPDGLTLLWRGKRLIGFGYAVAGHPADAGPRARRGWLVGLGVAPGERGHGLGSRLLISCLRYLSAAGCSTAHLGGNGERYLLPGADPAAYPEFRQLIQRHGFRQTGSTEAMACDLDPARLPVVAPAGERYHYRHPEAGDLPELLAMISGFSRGWAGVVRSHLARAGDAALAETGSLWAAYGPDGIVGFAGFDLFPGCPGRFGPMGVVPAVRGAGVGAALLRRALGSMAGRGHRRAWFLWGPEGAAGRRMYASAGFSVNRQFDFFSCDLRSPATAPSGIEKES
jgi:GNAT superfamily N-acetyltransferase